MSHPAADRNLLFGVIALQMDFILRDDLVTGMHAWVLDKGKPLGEILCERGVLSAERRALLDALVAEHLKQHGDDPQRSLAAAGTPRSFRRDLLTIADADVQASLADVSACPSGDGVEVTGPYVPPTPPAARFRVLRPHARGGLGEVFVARDEELRREVALKEIQERHAHNPESRARFLLEAEVTGGLEHPGVVPVYGLGAYPDGRPYYAMRFVRGENLKEAVARFHREQASLPAGERLLRLRGLLSRFMAVCNAVAYAHSRGVIHRDLKPANILLGEFGETLVVDWGLAKVVGRAEAAGAEQPLRPSPGDDPALTRTGAALGTPAYMSPEQAAGRPDRVGPRSDVYSLGATLYCLLAGRPPFAEGDAGDVLNQAQRGRYPRPRQANPRVAAALEAICLRAMAPQPEGRYATPRELAEEVERWLADQPVRAYREPWLPRLARWVRRHPKAVTGSAVACGFLVFFVVLAYSLGSSTDMRFVEVSPSIRLQSASSKELPYLIGPGTEVNWSRPEMQAELRRKWQEDGLSDGQRLRIALALAPSDGEVRRRLVDLAGQAADPQEVVLAGLVLLPFADEVREHLSERTKRPDCPAAERLRLLVLSATVDPENPVWREQARAAADQFLPRGEDK